METELGFKIKKLRKDNGMTQQNLANAMNVTKSAISLYENNKKQPSLRNLVKIAKHFNVSTDYLLDINAYKEKNIILTSIKLNKVNSSRIKRIGWEDNIMAIEFNDGSIYYYYNVSNCEYNKFLSSKSLGKELFKFDKKHNYKKIL